MKLSNTHATPVETNIANKSSSFSIKSSPKAFQILTDKLYSDKISAIIRELSCNAYDSHVAAGKPNEPFTVHLPTTLEPWFSVKDFGVGLSHTEVVNVFTTFFESTKADSNAFVGALGLGSKSPFAYVDSYTVTSFKDGIVNNYTCFKSEEGTPQVLLISSKKTKESNGLTIHVPVKHNDIQEFTSKAVNIFFYFKTIPNVNAIALEKIKHLRKAMVDDAINLGCSDANYYVATEDYFGISADSDTHNNNWKKSVTAVMGNVAYPVNLNMVYGESPKINIPCNILLYFSIGELDVSPSREALSYDKTTIAALKKTLEDSVKNILAKSHDKVMLNTKWEAMVAYYSLFGRSGEIYTNKQKAIHYADSLKGYMAVHKNTSSLAVRKDEHPIIINSLRDVSKRNNDYTRPFTPSSKVVFFYDDTKLSKTKIDKAIQYIQKSYGNKYELITVFTNKRLKFKQGKFDSIVNKVIRDFGSPPVGSLAKLLENYPDANNQVKTNSNCKRIPVCYYYCSGGMANYTDADSQDKFDNAKDYLWQIIKSNEYLDAQHFNVPRSRAALLATIAQEMFPLNHVCIIPITYTKQLKNPVYIWEFMQMQANLLLQGAGFIREWVFHQNYFVNLQHYNIVNLKDIITDTEVKNFLLTANKSISSPNVKNKIALIDFFSLTKPPSYVTLKVEMEALNLKAQKYHLLTKLDTAYVSRLSNNDRHKLINYLES